MSTKLKSVLLIHAIERVDVQHLKYNDAWTCRYLFNTNYKYNNNTNTTNNK